MSLAALRDRAHGESTAAVRRTLARVLFGDRYGRLLFCCALCLFGLVWRTDVFINDTYTLANGLYSLTNGEVGLTDAAYGPGLETPGAYPVSDGLVARNYGAIVLAVPFWALLEALTAVASLRVALVGLWCLTLLAAVIQLDGLVDTDGVVLGGGLAVLALFVSNVALARSLPTDATHLYALQLFHMTVAAFAPVLLYRLLSRLSTRRVALAAAVVLVLGTPLSLWAPVPKRHAITTTVVLGVAYTLYRSRTEPDGALFNTERSFRALAYALVGLYAWVHAPEALLLLVVLFAVDFPTAVDNSVRTLAVVTSAFVLSLLPFVLTNVVVTGSPITPPRLLNRGAEFGASSGVRGGSGGGTSLLAPLTSLLSPVLSLTRPFRLLARELIAGVTVFRSTPDVVYHTLVRSGDAAAALDVSGQESVNLTVLESAPVLGALAGGIPAVWRNRRGITTAQRRSATTAVDLFAVLTVVTVALLYANRLPLHAQVTVRYLFPVYPLGVYLLVRLPVVRETLDTHWRLFAWATAVTTFIGGQLLVVVVFWTVAGLGEAFQLHALLALATALPLAVWALFGRSDGVFGRAGAILLAAPTALTALFVLVVAVEYYPIGDSQFLPTVRAAAELLDLL